MTASNSAKSGSPRKLIKLRISYVRAEGQISSKLQMVYRIILKFMKNSIINILSILNFSVQFNDIGGIIAFMIFWVISMI